MEYSEYKKLQEDGSDWSYNSRWGDQMVDAITDWFGKDVMAAESPSYAMVSILDVGCGEGRGLEALKEMGFQNTAGVDITMEKIQAGMKRGLEIIDDDFNEMAKFSDDSIDYIFCSHTLEHALDLKQALSSLLRVVKKKIYIIVPIDETEESVKANPAHTAPITESVEIADVLDTLQCEYVWEEKMRMNKEAWFVITKR